MILDFLIALIATCLIMITTWAFARRIYNYGVIDAVWSLTFAAHAVFFALAGDGWETRRVVLAVVVAIWSLRLGLFLARRIHQHHPVEDTRYQKLRQDYSPNVASRFFWFFQYQAWSVSLLTIPFLLIAANPEATIAPIEWIGVVLFAVSVLGESLADAQMSRFKKNPANRGKTCDIGLWKYSRHPNYFFESCIWWSFYLIALGSPWGWTTIHAPLAILFLLLKVTGVPPSEAQSLRSRGEAYRAYQQRTSKFVPWFPRKDRP